MLRISKKADYAVFLLGAIARQGAYPGGEAEASVVSAHEIARQAGLNKSVVANLLKEFAKHGLLESVRGLKGGYKLVRAPRQISLAEILEVVEGKFTLVDCIEVHGTVPARSHSEPRSEPRSEPHSEPVAAASPLALARQQPAESVSTCSLIAFCPSKNPMRVVHDRISHLFQQIRLDELCNLPSDPRSATSVAPSVAPSVASSEKRALGSPR